MGRQDHLYRFPLTDDGGTRKPVTCRLSDPILLHFMEEYCVKMQWKPNDLMKHAMYKFFDDLGVGASLTRPDTM